VFRSRQISVDVCHPEIEAGQREVHTIRQRRRKMLPPQTVLGTILNQNLRFELGITPQFKVGSESGTLAFCLNTRRYHTVQEFNKGVYDYIIASDESAATAEHDTDDEVEEVEQEECAFSPLIRLLNDQHSHSDVNTARGRRVVGIGLQKRKRSLPVPPSSRKRKQRKGGEKNTE
jgi:hypothetical protein